MGITHDSCCQGCENSASSPLGPCVCCVCWRAWQNQEKGGSTYLGNQGFWYA